MILEKGTIEFTLKTQNPFVVTMYHYDHYPKGDGQLKPVVKRPSKQDGDFDMDASWRMYYGIDLPGFPAHPHRGFETVTIVMQGTVDHTDGLGSMGRYSNGDVQWMTAGKGLQHAEMFPLVKTDEENVLELFQVWLSLDSKNRMVAPSYKMLWREDIPIVKSTDKEGLSTKITVIAGEVDGIRAPSPTKDSWAMDKKNHLSIQLIELDPGASYSVPSAYESMNRSLYFYNGDKILLEDQELDEKSYVFVTAGDETRIVNSGGKNAKLFMLEAEPIPEPILAYGPFVMTTQEEIKQAYHDFRETGFGGWPFSEREVYHDVKQKRFAKYDDGREEYPDKV